MFSAAITSNKRVLKIRTTDRDDGFHGQAAHAGYGAGFLMCGICGFSGAADPPVLEQMVRRLTHRGPDDEGRYSDHDVSLGVRRLRVIDPAGGRQPMTNKTQTVQVILNGEIYNHAELRDELLSKGHRFASRSDTEVLVHLYEEEGEAAIARLRGMFAFAVWDRSHRTLLLARDWLGIKPLYYKAQGRSETGRTLVFASELPALLAAWPQQTIRPQSIADYLTLLYVPGPDTVFEGIRELPPGHLLKLVDDQIEVKRYFDPASLARRASIKPPGANNEAAAHFRDLLRETVRAHLISDVPLGLFLSGGLDSGAILAMMRSVGYGPIHTFSIGYDAADQSYDELDAARSVAKQFETNHTEARLQPDAVKLLAQVVAAMGEPFGDASAIPTFMVSELARRTVTVALSGIGGDELFGGYPRYLGLRFAQRYRALPHPVRRWMAHHLAPSLPESSTSRNRLGRVKRFLGHGDRELSEQYTAWTSFLPIEWGTKAFTPALADHVHDIRLQYRTRFESWPAGRPEDRAMGLDLGTYLPDDLLRMGDRVSMAHSLELRVPFCDHQLLTFALSLPSDVRFTGGRLKGFMRQALSDVLPRGVLRRPKAGFQVPLARWIREDLREMVRDVLAPAAVRRRGYVRPEYAEWLLREHGEGRRNLTDQLYALLVLELWHQQQQ